MAEPWWRDAVIYQIYIRSFADGDGDGLGDIAGIRSRLRLPGGPGRGRDLDQPLVPLADGRRRLRRVGLPRRRAPVRHPRGRRGAAARGPRARPAGAARHRPEPHLGPARRGSPRRWRPAPGPRAASATCSGRAAAPTARSRRTTGRPCSAGRPGSGSPSPTARPGEWYLHLFAPEQPDLNWEHPEVRADFERTLRFWFDRGVDGFRIDVAHSLVKEEGLPDAERHGVAAAAGRGRRRAAPGPLAAAPALGPRRGARGLPRLARGRRLLRPTRGCSSPRPGSTSPSGWPATCAPTSCTPPSTSPTSQAPWERRLPAARDRRDPRRAPSGRRAGRPGCCPTTTSPGTCRATPASRPCPAAA